MHQYTRACASHVCVYIQYICWQDNELRDMLREQGWNGVTLLNGDECVL